MLQPPEQPSRGAAGAGTGPGNGACPLCTKPGPRIPRSDASDGIVGLSVLGFLLAFSLFVLAVSFNWQALPAFGGVLGVVAVIGSAVGFGALSTARNEALSSSRDFDAEIARIATESARQDASLSQARLAAAALALSFSSYNRTYADGRSLPTRLLLASTAAFVVAIIFGSVLSEFFGWMFFLCLGVSLSYLAVVFLLVNPREYIPPLKSEYMRWFLWPDLPPRWQIVCDSIAGDPHLLALAQDLHLDSAKMPKTRKDVLDWTRPIY